MQKKLIRVLTLLMAMVCMLSMLAGCKVVPLPDKYNSSSSSASEFVPELAPLEEAVPVDAEDVCYLDKLNGELLFVSENPDKTFSLIHEADGNRVRLFTSGPNRQICFPLMNDACTTAAFMYVGIGGELLPGEFMGQLYTVDLESSETQTHDIYLRNYSDNLRGFYWHEDDVLFLSSAVVGQQSQIDAVGYYSVSNAEMTNIVGGDHVVDSARQGAVSPDGKYIVYSGYYENNGNFVHCIYNTETGETSYHYDRGYTGMSTDQPDYNDFIDDVTFIKTRTYSMPVDANGNIIYEDAVVEETTEEAEESESSEAEEAEAEETTDEEAASTEKETVLVNSIFTFDVTTIEVDLLIEHAYNPCVDRAKEHIYFHHTVFAESVKGEDNLSDRVFCYEIATGEITEVTETLGITSSYEIMMLESRIFD